MHVIKDCKKDIVSITKKKLVACSFYIFSRQHNRGYVFSLKNVLLELWQNNFFLTYCELKKLYIVIFFFLMHNINVTVYYHDKCFIT